MCVRPLKAWCVGLNENGNKNLFITDWSVDHVEKVKGVWIGVKEHDNLSDGLVSCPTHADISSLATSIVTQYITIPCGRCIECLKDRGQQWTNRCFLEYNTSGGENAFFVSLTYRDECLPVTYYADPSTGEGFPVYTLRKKDIQLFLKRCRKYFFGDEKGTLRYYICGEYGPTTMRPHYHCILFGLPLTDLVQSDNPHYFNSAVMAKLWPYGFHQISPLEPAMIAYTCHYVTGKLDPESYELYDLHSMERPFSVQSCKPSLGRTWYEQHKDEYMQQYDNPAYKISVGFEDKGYTFRPPKYFEYLLQKEGVSFDEVKKARRKKVAALQELELERTDLSYTEQLAAKERQQLSKYANLLRRDKL